MAQNLGPIHHNIYVYIERERGRERLVQVTPDVTLKSYTFFKPLDLSRSND